MVDLTKNWLILIKNLHHLLIGIWIQCPISNQTPFTVWICWNPILNPWLLQPTAALWNVNGKGFPKILLRIAQIFINLNTNRWTKKLTDTEEAATLERFLKKKFLANKNVLFVSVNIRFTVKTKHNFYSQSV